MGASREPQSETCKLQLLFVLCSTSDPFILETEEGVIVQHSMKHTDSCLMHKTSTRCIHGDSRLVEETSKAFKKDKKLVKGIAFPTCISVNNCICHFSPLVTEPDVTLADGDLVKIDLGAHIDGFIAVVAHTLVVGATGDSPVTGKKADAILAAHLASEAALRLVKPGNETYEVQTCSSYRS